jgi:2-polyprenyl-6-methoxyphenol hydroxylase-like FAD-dependent oxidoreductase
MKPVVIGAGITGLVAAYELMKNAGRRRTIHASTEAKISAIAAASHSNTSTCATAGDNSVPNATAISAPRPRTRRFVPNNEFVPQLTDANKCILRFTRIQARGRTAQTAFVDNMASVQTMPSSLLFWLVNI